MNEVSPIARTKRSPVITQMPEPIIKAILAAQEEVKALGKNERNGYSRYDYAGIDQYYADIAPLIRKHGLSWTTRVENMHFLPQKPDEAERVLAEVSIDLKYQDGTVIENYASYDIIHLTMNAQTTGSIVSYANKFFMRAEFKVPTGEKDADAYPTTHVIKHQPANANTNDSGYRDIYSNTERKALSSPTSESREKLEQDLKAALERAYAEKYILRWLQGNKARLNQLRYGNAEEQAFFARLKTMWEDRKAELLAQQSARIQRGQSYTSDRQR
jgi:uncharacterized protein Veg